LAAHFLVADNLPGKLTIMPCPSGDQLAADMAGFAVAGIDRIVSMLAPDEIVMLGLAQEPVLARQNGITFEDHAIVDFGLPDRRAFQTLVSGIVEELRAGRHVAVHCRAGIGRSGMVVGAVLIALGASAQGAIDRVSTARGVSVPDTIEQRQFMYEFATGLRA
jgi:protein-tyrosine phosphatase